MTTIIGGCAGTQHGCCEDGTTAKRDGNGLGCPEYRLVGGCAGTRYGCCDDGRTAKGDENGLGCDEGTRETRIILGGCAGTRYGCCEDRVSSATGPNRDGCLETRPLLGISGCMYSFIDFFG